MKSLLVLSFFLSSFAVAGSGAPGFAGRDEMNGLRFKDYADFHSKWHLVTVRFRKDTGEQRFTYANDLAWSVLKNGKTDYPDGAAFGKIGFATQDDPAFPSSAVPSGSRRYQLMVKDSKKYASTDGWGYALFDKTGKTFGEDPSKAVIACQACHRAASAKGYVFSQMMTMDAGEKLAPPSTVPSPVVSFVEFEDLSGNKLPATLRADLPLGKTIRSVRGSLRDHLFQGTLDEIRPQLALEAIRTGKPAALLSRDNQYYSIVFVDSSSRECAAATPGAMSFVAIYSAVESDPDAKTRESLGERSRVSKKRLNFCQKP